MKLFCLKGSPKPFQMEELLEFVSMVNSIPEQNSAYCSDNKKGIEQQLLKSIENGFAVACKESNVLIGFCDCAYDKETTTANCNLLVHPKKIDVYDEIAEVMLRVLEQQLPEDAKYRFSLAKSNTLCKNFLKEHKARSDKREMEKILIEIAP